MACYVRYGAVLVLLGITACGFPRPTRLGSDDGGLDASGADSAVDSATVDSGRQAGDAPDPICTANQPLRCDGSNLVRCNTDGTSETSESCVLGCAATGPRCNDVNPSNGLAQYLDMTEAQPTVDLGNS